MLSATMLVCIPSNPVNGISFRAASSLYATPSTRLICERAHRNERTRNQLVTALVVAGAAAGLTFQGLSRRAKRRAVAVGARRLGAIALRGFAPARSAQTARARVSQGRQIRRPQAREILPFKRVATPDRGNILVSTRPLRKGDVFYRETPLLSVPAGDFDALVDAFLSLSPDRKFAVLDLYCPDEAPSHVVGQQGNFTDVLGKRGEGLEELLRDECGWSVGKIRSNIDDIWRLLRIYDANSILWAEYNVVTLFENMSRMNHSCEPTVYLLKPPHEKGEILWLASTDIEAGEELCINYIEDIDGTGAIPMLPFLLLPVARRRKLVSTWGFDCECPRCQGLDGFDVARAFKCPACGSGSVLASCRATGSSKGKDGVGAEGNAAALVSSQCSRCQACGEELSVDEVTRLLKAEAAAVRKAELAFLLRGKWAVRRGSHMHKGLLAKFAAYLKSTDLSVTHWLYQWIECLGGRGPLLGLEKRPWRKLPRRLRDYFEVVALAELNAQMWNV